MRETGETGGREANVSRTVEVDGLRRGGRRGRCIDEPSERSGAALPAGWPTNPQVSRRPIPDDCQVIPLTSAVTVMAATRIFSSSVSSVPPFVAHGSLVDANGKVCVQLHGPHTRSALAIGECDIMGASARWACLARARLGRHRGIYADCVGSR